MEERINARRVIGLLAASIALAGAMGVATAEQPAELKGITVTAKRMMTVERPVGVVEQEVRIKTLVNYSDLDITTGPGMKALESRVREAASDACTELDKLLPTRTLEHGNCVSEATDRTMAEVKK